MPRFELRAAGQGGQGIILIGIVLGTAASVYAGKWASQTQSYGPEARGGACKSEVVISDEEIDYPLVDEPHIVAIMSQEAYDKYAHSIRDDGILLLDPDMVTNVKPMKNPKVLMVPATRMAELLGRKMVANMVMVGAITAVTTLLDLDSVKDAIAKNVPRGTEGLNLQAFMDGYEYAKGQKVV